MRRPHTTHAHAVVDIETGAVLSRHRTPRAAQRGQEKWGPPTKVVYTSRRVGEAVDVAKVTE